MGLKLLDMVIWIFFSFIILSDTENVQHASDTQSIKHVIRFSRFVRMFSEPMEMVDRDHHYF
jgi:hypothetical protein